MTREFLQPSTLAEAVEILNSHEDLVILAGGTDLLVLLHEGSLSCRYIMDIKKIPELNVFGKTENGLDIGGAVTLTQLLESGLVDGPYAILKDSAITHSNTMLRNRATMIGNICNASPGGDMLPAALLLDGTLEAASAGGVRRIPLNEFFTGVKKHVLQKNELVTKISFPVKKGKGVFLKKKRIKGYDLAQVCMGAFWEDDGKLSIALGAVAQVPLLFSGLGPFDREGLVKARADVEATILGRISPRANSIRSTREYRIAMIKHFIGEIILQLTEGAYD